jgi:signal transduction histidine kinase
MGAERRHPLRFVWELDEEGCFRLGSDEFIELMGIRTASMIGKPWAEMATELALDPDGHIARAIATRDTWSGLTVSWPAGDRNEPLAVELSGLPIFDRDRIFRGYRGFGVCRDLARLSALAGARQTGGETKQPRTPEQEAQDATPAQSTELEPSANNIVAFPAGATEVLAPGLTPVEHMAFREISRKLAQGLSAASANPDAQTASFAPAHDEASIAQAHSGNVAPDAHMLLDHIPLAILIYRLDRLLYANPMFLDWCGHPSLGALAAAGGLDQLLIEPIGPAGTARDQSVTLTIDGRARAALQCKLISIKWESEGSHALIAVRAESEPPARLATLKDEIAELKQNEQELLESARRAESASSAKSDFLAKISHEIRTPLNSIIGFSEVMMNEQFGAIGNARYREYLKDIHSASGHLLSLINDLLDLSKIEAGKLTLTFSAVALNEIIAQCVASMGPQASSARIVMRTALAPALPRVVADARSVRQIVLNLLSNSLKFTSPGGQVIISTGLNDAGEVVLRVRDNGVGMSENEIATALEPFRQLSTTPRGGTGLGLPLTKAMAEANRATFHLTSAPKEGTLVEITFAADSTA